MTDFQLTSPESSVAIASEVIQRIRETLAETRDKGVSGAVGFDELGDATDLIQQLDDLAEEYGCLVDGPYDSEEANGGRYYLFERQDAPNVVDGCWLTKPEPESAGDTLGYLGLA